MLGIHTSCFLYRNIPYDCYTRVFLTRYILIHLIQVVFLLLLSLLVYSYLNDRTIGQRETVLAWVDYQRPADTERGRSLGRHQSSSSKYLLFGLRLLRRTCAQMYAAAGYATAQMPISESFMVVPHRDRSCRGYFLW